MADEIKKPVSKPTAHYLVLEDLSYSKNGNIVVVKKGVEDVFLNEVDVPQEALTELVERDLVKVITL